MSASSLFNAVWTSNEPWDASFCDAQRLWQLRSSINPRALSMRWVCVAPLRVISFSPHTPMGSPSLRSGRSRSPSGRAPHLAIPSVGRADGEPDR